MATQASTPTTAGGHPDISWRGNISLEEREALVRESAYYQYVQRGCADGHDLEDWLAAEAYIDRGSPEWEPVELAEFEMQESGVHGPREDDDLKRIVKQHPQKAIPQVESVEPQEAPPNE